MKKNLFSKTIKFDSRLCSVNVLGHKWQVWERERERDRDAK